MQLSLASCLVCLLVHAAFCAAEGQGWQAFKNDATEIIPGLGGYPEPPQELENNQTMNRAENGGRPPHHPYDTKGMGWRSMLAWGSWEVTWVALESSLEVCVGG